MVEIGTRIDTVVPIRVGVTEVDVPIRFTIDEGQLVISSMPALGGPKEAAARFYMTGLAVMTRNMCPYASTYRWRGTTPEPERIGVPIDCVHPYVQAALPRQIRQRVGWYPAPLIAWYLVSISIGN